MPDNALSSKATDDFLKRIKSEKKVRLVHALQRVKTHQCDPNSVPENQRIDLGLSSYFLAKQYRYGEGTEPDYSLSLACYKFSAQLGNPKACYTLGRMYLLGNESMSIKKNHLLALSYIEMCDKRQCGVLLREKLSNLKKIIETVKEIHSSTKKKKAFR